MGNKPRMCINEIQLLCEVAAVQPAGVIRWMHQGSTMMSGVSVVVAEGATSREPSNYAVTVSSDPNNGLTRSVLTILRPQPNSQQAAYYCQYAAGSPRSPFKQSRDVFLLGNRRFINANMAYLAADTFKR